MYSLEGGKCIRGFIIKHLIEHLTGQPTTLWEPIVSIELIHGVSLVIDDLPCMDNDNMRRNKPSTFAQYGERSAILTSLFGLSESFRILFEGVQKIGIDNKLSFIIKMLSEWNELIGKNLIVGQMLDLKENIEQLVNHKIEYNHTNLMLYKTCSLFMFAFILGGLFSNCNVNIDDYKMMGYWLGLMFQIMDDSRDTATDNPHNNIILGKGNYEAQLQYIDAKTKLLDLLNNNNIYTEPLMKLINTIDSMVQL